MSEIVLDRITKRYGDARSAAAVDGVSLRVASGSLTTLLGPSGCGKTTTLRLVAGLESATSGRILIGGQDVTVLGPAEREVGMMFQSYALFPHMSVQDNVGYGLRMKGEPASRIRQRVDQALAQVGLPDMHTRLPSELSGGQQQRVALARALVVEPRVLLFDEPLSNLDARLRRAMRDEIRRLQQSLQLTVVYVTHDQDEALAVSDQIVVMHQGRIAQQGTPQDLYERPANAFVASFMGEALLLDGQRHADGSVWIGALPVPQPSAHTSSPGPVHVAVRPQAWRVVPSGQGLEARLLRRSYLGAHWELTFETALGPIMVTVANPEAQAPTPANCSLVLQASGVSVISAEPAASP